jgi:hypothetical protein
MSRRTGQTEPKIIHKVRSAAVDGVALLLCDATHRRLNLQRDGWTLCDRFVNCAGCLHAMKHEGEAAA